MLWSRPQAGLSPARVGYFGPKTSLQASTLYLLSFYYRTEYVTSQGAAIYFPTFPDFSDYHYLPDTGGQWRQYLVLGWTGTDPPAAFWPFFTVFHKGSVWYDKVQVRRVILAESPSIVDRSSRWSIR